MKTTLKDIAEDCGYSVSTVSRALRGDSSIHPDSERKIIQSARRLKYAHLPHTPAVDKLKDPFFAIITDFHEGEFYSSFYNGFIKASESTAINYGLHSVSNNADVELIIEEIQLLKRFGYHGGVLFVPHLTRDDYQKILDTVALDFPLLSTSVVHQPVMDTIAFDAYSGGFSVAKHFWERGYTRAAILLGPHNKPEALIRANGFADFSRQNPGFTIVWQFKGDYSLTSGQQAFAAFEKLKAKPQAVFAANDDMALGFMQAALAKGYNLPGDIGLAGYDDLRLCSIMQPNLTSVHTDFEALAGHIGSILTRRLDKPVEHQGIQNLIPVSLAVRQST